jgi:hypothetical protein
MRRPAILLVPVFLVTLLAGLVRPAAAQSLADVSRREEERRKQSKEGKVYTNKDLHPVSAVPAPPPAATGETVAAAKEGGQAADAKPADSKPAGQKDEAFWRGRMKELRTELDRNKTYLDALQSRVNALNTDFVNRDDPAQQAVIGADRQKALDELGRLKSTMAQTEKAIADLQEEARRANVPVGWLR